MSANVVRLSLFLLAGTRCLFLQEAQDRLNARSSAGWGTTDSRQAPSGTSRWRMRDGDPTVAFFTASLRTLRAVLGPVPRKSVCALGELRPRPQERQRDAPEEWPFDRPA